MKNSYTSEVNIQILVSLLKKHNIKNIIASPGTTNISFVASVQNDDFFNVYSCVDERSASYLACGMAAETGQPVVITCTGATASRNYIPGLTEAFYRKLPVIAITATQHLGRVGQNVAQVIDRSVQLKDMVKASIQLPSVYSEEDRWFCNLSINNILLETKRNGGGPVHINMVTTYSNDFSCSELPDEKKIDRISINDAIPKLEKRNVAIFIGNHRRFSENETENIEEFCEKYNAVVLCDHTSNYNGKYKVIANLICSQAKTNALKETELLIDMGNVSGAYLSIMPKEVWRISTDGEIRDTFKKIKYVFDMPENEFFNKYNALKDEKKETTYYEQWKNEDKRLQEKLAAVELPFSNLWIASKLIKNIPDESTVHLAILNTLRSWNYYNTSKHLNSYSNTGGFGIDGIVSTAIGASLATNQNVYCVVGDLAFFYDLNSIGNMEIKNNLRILLINNGTGTEFHNYNHRAVAVSNSNDLSLKYFAADGHFGNKSQTLVKHYSEDLGFEYLCAHNKEEFENNLKEYLKEWNEKPIVFEVFTEPDKESEALKLVNNLDINVRSFIKEKLGEKNINKIKKVLKK